MKSRDSHRGLQKQIASQTCIAPFGEPGFKVPLTLHAHLTCLVYFSSSSVNVSFFSAFSLFLLFLLLELGAFLLAEDRWHDGRRVVSLLLWLLFGFG